MTKKISFQVLPASASPILFGIDALAALGLGTLFDTIKGKIACSVVQKGRNVPFSCESEALPAMEEYYNIHCQLEPAPIEERLTAPPETSEAKPEESVFKTNPDLSPARQSLCVDTLSKFEDVFYKKDQSTFWKSIPCEHTIPLIKDEAPKAGKRKYSPKKQEILEKQFAEWKEKGIIEPCPHSDFRNHPMVVEKKGCKPRVCFDYRALNKITIRSPYPSKDLRNVMAEFNGAKWISKLDLTSSYLQVPIKASDRYKTAFMTSSGLYQMVGMAFGLVGAGDTMQRLMDSILSPVKEIVTNYVDDTWVVTKNDDFDEHLQHIKKVLEIFRKYGLFINKDKCGFAYQEIDALGHLVSGRTSRVPEHRIRAVAELAPPKNRKELGTALGTFGFYRRFIERFAEIATPLTELTRKDVKWDWRAEQQAAFEKLKSAMISPPILRLPDPSKPYLLRTDASGFAVGAALLQEHDGMWMPVAYYSKKLSKAERDYTTTEREGLGLGLG